MNKRLSIFLVFVFVLLCIPASAKGSSSYAFKYYMHQIFFDYSHAQSSFLLKKYDVTDILLRHLQTSIKELPDFIPEYNMDGTKLDKELFIQRLNEFQRDVSDLRGAIQKRELEEIKKLPQKVFNMCIECHEEAKLKYLFRIPRRITLFGKFMHKISDHLELAGIYMEDNEVNETRDHLKMINFYLELLEDTFPDAVPSGVILDKDDFIRRVKEVKRFNEEIQEKVGEKKLSAIDPLRKSLNEICAACHEPERLK